MTSDERIKQLEDDVALLLAFKRETETRMLTMKHKVLDLEQEIKQLKQRISAQGSRGSFGHPD